MQQQQSGQDPRFIKDLFGSIAGTYDRANDAITFGFAHRWRDALVRWSGAGPKSQVLDCATGTGDLAFDFAKIGVEKVHGIDFTPKMIEIAQAKNVRRAGKIKFAVGDALKLEFESGTFDITSISYGIRNVADMGAALKEMARVTRPGGSVMILETGKIENPVVRWSIQFYFQTIVPRVGGYISGRRDAYDYLQRSSLKFDSGKIFCEYLRGLDLFSSVDYRPMMGGASFVYKAVTK